VALTGLAVPLVYKIGVTGLKAGAGFAAHVGHEWAMLANLFALLLGVALL